MAEKISASLALLAVVVVIALFTLFVFDRADGGHKTPDQSKRDWQCCHYAKDRQVKCKPVSIITVRGRGLPIAQLGVLRYDDTWWERAKGYYRFYPDNFRKACSWDDAR